MDSCASLSPTRTMNTRARPEVVRVRQLEKYSSLVNRSVGFQYTNNGTNGVHMTSKQQARHNNPMRAHNAESFMIASPDDVRMAKQSRLTCYHHDTPMPLRYQERLSYNIPSERNAERDAALEFYFGLSPTTSISTSSPCLDFRVRGKELKYGNSDCQERAKHDYDYQCIRQTGRKFNALYSNIGENRLGNDSCHCSNEIGFGCSLRNGEIPTTILGPAEERFDMPHNPEPNLRPSRKDNKQKSNTPLFPNPKFANDRKRDSPYLLLSNDSKPKRFTESVARCKSSLSGLKSNVDEIKLDGDLQNEVQTDFIAYSAADDPPLEHQGTKTIRINAYNRENNNKEEFTRRGVPSQIGRNPKNPCTEYHFTKEPARGQFSSPNGAEVWHSEEVEGLFTGQTSDCVTEEHAVCVKQGFVRELDSEVIKRSSEQNRYNSRSVVQLVFAGNKPDKEKEADKFITLIDESFTDFSSDKACAEEKPRDDRSINGVNLGRRTEVRQCLKLKRDEAICSRDIEGNNYCATGRESCTAGASTQDCNTVVQQSLCRELDPHANKPKAFPESSSFEQIKRQLFNEAGLSDERNDVIDETTNCPKESSFVRTIHQSVGDKESVGDCIDDDVVYVVNESAGRLAHNNDRNPKSDAILKTPRGKLAGNKNSRSPFIRTIYQDCGLTNDYITTSGRPVSPFSDSIISAVAICSQDHKRHEYQRLRRRDRRLRYLSEPGIFSTLGLRTLGAMSRSSSGSSCGEKSSNNCANIVGGDLRSSELTEQALRAHTLSLKANSPSVRRRPTLDQFFGKVSEQGLHDNISEQSDFSSHSDSVLMVQRANKVNLTPVSGLLNGGLRSPNKNSRALRMKAWKNRHENIFKSTRTATHGDISERVIEKPGNPSRQEIPDKDNNNICLDDIEANCVKSVGLIGERSVMELSRPKEISKVTGGNNNKITENASGFVAGTNCESENNNSVFEESESFHFGFADSDNTMNGETSNRKSVGSEDSFEEVFVEPDLINCSPPAIDRPTDTADSSNHMNLSRDSVSDDVKDKKDSLDVFVGSASAILERVKRLKLKYNHKTTAISPFSEEKDENGNIDAIDGNSGSGCLIPSPTLLKDSPKIKTIDIFSKGLNNFDSLTIDYNRKRCKNPDLKSSKRSSSSLDELRQDYSPTKDKGSCYNSEENIYNTWTKASETVNEMTTNEAQKLLKCLDNATRFSIAETKEEHKEIREPLFVENELANIDGMLHRASCDEDNVFVTERENEMTSEQDIVPNTSKFESEGRVRIYEQTNSRDKSRSEGLCVGKHTDSKHVEIGCRSSKQRNNIDNQNGDINGGNYGESKFDQAYPHFIPANGIALKAGCNRGSPNTDSTQGNSEKLPNDQVNSTDLLKTNNNGAADGSPQCNFISVDKAENTTLFEGDSFLNRNSQAANQGSLNISPLVLFENKEHFNNTEKEKPCSLNGLSSKFEGINSDNTREISLLAGRKDNIESGEFSYWRDGLSSRVNMIIEESKDSTVELAGISDKTYEVDVCNGISPQIGKDIQISGNQGTYSKAKEKFPLDDAPDAIERLVNKRELSRKAGNDTFGEDGLGQVALESSFTSVPCGIAEEDSERERINGNSEIERDCGGGSSNTFQRCRSTLPIKEDARGENDRERLSNVVGTGCVNNEIDQALIANEDTADMSRAKGVSDLKKQFENYQPKGEKKADVAKGNVKKQIVLNDPTQKDECIEAKMTASTKGSSKLGALKSMFESEKAEPFKLPLAKIMSPKLSRTGFTVRNIESKQASTDNRDIDGILRSSGICGIENYVDIKNSNDKRRKNSPDGHTEKEKLDVDSKGCVKNMPDDQKLNLSSGNNANLPKHGKIPPPVKRKPSLKRKDIANANEVSPKSQEKSDTMENTSANKIMQDVDRERKEGSVTEKKRDADKRDLCVVVQEHCSTNNNGILRDDNRASEHVIDSEEAQRTLLRNSGVRKEEESVGKFSPIANEGGSHRGQEVNTKDTNLPKDFKDTSKEVGIFNPPSEEDHKATNGELENRMEMGVISRNCEGANGNPNEKKYSESMKCEVLGPCGDAEHINAEETIASLISELERACILTIEDGFVENGGKKGDIVQREFDKLADNKEITNKNERNGQWKDGERRLESNQDKMLSITSETTSKKHNRENGYEISHIESGDGKIQDNFPVVVKCHGSEGEHILKNSDEKENVSLNSSYDKGENRSKELDNLGRHICTNHLSNPKAAECIQISNAHYVTVETEMAENRSIDQNCELTCHPISGLLDPHNLLTSQSDGLTKAPQLTENGKGCGTNRGKDFCNEHNGLLNAEISEKDKDRKSERKMLSARSHSSSSDSSLEESEPIRPKAIDYDSLPTVGLPALLRESKVKSDDAKTTEEDIVQQQQQQQQQQQKQQPHHYISYSSIKSNTGINGMLSRPEEGQRVCVGKNNREMVSAKEHKRSNLATLKQDQISPLSDLSGKGVDETESQGLESDCLTGNINEAIDSVDETESVEDLSENVACESRRSNASIVIQSSPLTSERNNSLNVAKVSPYFHDRSSRTFTEPVAKFGGGIFGDALLEDENGTDILSKEGRTYEDQHTGCTITRDSDIKGPTMQELEKLEVVLKVPKDSLREDCINLGVISTDGFSHWNDLEKEVTNSLLEHIKLISDDCLGITKKDIEYLQIGKHKINIGDGKELTRYSKEDGARSRCIVQLQENWTGSVASLSYQLLIPKRTLEKYLSLVMNHRCLIFCGQSGTGKSYLASKIAFDVAGRFSEIGNNNMTEPLHAVNVNAERWKGIKETVLQRVSQSMPVVLVIDGFTPDFHEGIENLASLLKQVDSQEIYVIAALNQATQEITVKWQNSIRWIWLDNNEEPVHGLLTRYLRKKFLNTNHGSKELFDIVDWISSVWKHVNKIIESFHSAEQTIGPAMFFSCPSSRNDIEEWFADTWNYSLAPYILHTVRTGLKLFGQRCEWIDPLQWILNTYPWKKEKSLLANLKKIRKSDVGYYDIDKKYRDSNSSSGDQHRLMNFLRRLETMVDNKTLVTGPKPGTTQRRIYLESTL